MRYGYKVDHILRDENLTLVMGRDDRSTNPKYQYPCHAELQLEGWIIKLTIPTVYGWNCQVPGLQSGKTWYMDKVREWVEANLHHATSLYKLGERGMKIPAKGRQCPAVVARQLEIAEKEKAKKEAALRKHQASVQALEHETKKAADAFYVKLKTAKTFAGFDGFEEIISVEGEGPEALVNLKSQKTQKFRTVEAKWLQAGGVKSLS